jgi:DNA-binding transcriptional MerR regulator
VPIPERPSEGWGERGLYALSDVARLFEIPESRLRYWSQTGFIAPAERHRGRRYYTFQDLISVKVAKELLDAGLPLQRVRRSLDALRYHLPRIDSPLARLRLRSDHDRIVVEDGDATFDSTTGQMLLDFDVEKLRDRVAEVLHLPWVEDGHDARTAYEWFLHGQAREAAWDGDDSDEPAFEDAVEAYEKAIELDPSFAAAWTNLGSLVALGGDEVRARDCFDHALLADPDQPEARCNLAELALRAGEIEVAIAGFREVLREHAEHADAHYGLARGLLAVGGKGQALAHLERFCVALERLPRDEWDDELEHRRNRVVAVIDALRRELAGIE